MPDEVTMPCRLSLVFAAEAPVAVVLRRGPRQWVEVIKWRTDTDDFAHGQWFHGRIYSERCGLSPDGTLFVYFAMKHGWPKSAQGYERTFTAVSRPPFLTALAMWPQGDTWGGGGRFVDNRTLRLAYGSNGTLHPGIADTEICMAPYREPHPEHLPRGLEIQTDLDRYGADRGFVERVDDHGTWTGTDHRGRRIVARDGCILVAREDATETLLADFNADSFRAVVAPAWATTW